MESMRALKKAIALLGGVGRTAEALELTQPAVSLWLIRKSLPLKYAPQIEALTNGKVRREQLAPEMYIRKAKVNRRSTA